jgi:MFS family permease
LNNTYATARGIPSAECTSTRNLTRTQSLALVGAAAIGMCGGYTALFASTVGVFLLPVATSLGVGRGTASAVMGLSLLGIAFGSPLAGKLIDRFGVAAVVSGSVFLFAVALMSLAIGPMTITGLSVKVFLLGLVSVATSPVGYLPILARTFERRLGLALGMASVGLGIGSALSPMFAGAMIARFGWHTAYLFLSGLAVLLGAAALYIVFGSSTLAAVRSAAAAARGNALTNAELPGDSARIALSSGRFWLIGASLALVSAVGIGNLVHIPSLLSDHGLSRPVAATGATFAAIGVMCGRLMAGVLLDVMKARYVAALIFAIGGAGIGLLASAGPASSYALFAFGATLTGLLVGAEGDLMPYLVRRYFGLKAFGLVYGLLVSIFSLGGLAGPVLYGVAFDRFGNYSAVLGASVVGCLLGAIGMLCIGSYRYHGVGTRI